MLKFCSLRRSKEPAIVAPKVAKSSSLRLKDVPLNDAQLLQVLHAQRERGPLILALSSAENAAQTCRKCGTPYENRQVVENRTTGELQVVVGACYYNESSC
ncbi:GM21201 [Drosophila sechellia]|uniref:GM21201 n=1 Tax=Drosophila sechellia TaxID=7238 RepID=B4HMF5_DROSE|nr:GM21201 [Drosophila sechellia]